MNVDDWFAVIVLVIMLVFPAALGWGRYLEHQERVRCIDARGDWDAASRGCKFPTHVPPPAPQKMRKMT